MNTHGLEIGFGRHKGTLFTRVPASYLRWMVNERSQEWEIAQAEIDRRGHSLPEVELSGHAIDSASFRVLKVWESTRTKDEGLHSWLERMVLEAIEANDVVDKGKQSNGRTKLRYNGMELVIKQGEEFPALVTVTRSKKDSK